MNETDSTEKPNTSSGSTKEKTFYNSSAASKSNAIEIPGISLPKGGGAIKGIDEKFSVNAANGTASSGIPLPFTAAKGSPNISLGYNSGSGNSVFGLGWSLGLPGIQRKTDKQLPRYADFEESDVFQIAGAEDLVPALKADGTADEFSSGNFNVKRYRPRIEGGFARIERIWPKNEKTFYWKVTDSSNNVTFYGRSANARIANPENAEQVFRWLPEFAFDDKGSLSKYEYKAENGYLPNTFLHDKNRYAENGEPLFTNRYLKRVRYGNRIPFYPDYISNPQNSNSFYDPQLPAGLQFYFEAVFDYGEHGDLPVKGDFTATVSYDELNSWTTRADAFSEYRSGFEIRTNRLCRRMLMFHLFDELGDTPCLVRSLDITYAGSQEGTTVFAEVTYLAAATIRGYTRENGTNYFQKALPPVTYEYEPLAWQKSIQSISTDDLKNLPEGLGGNFQWVDLFNEGISGILSEQGNAFYYKSNLGDGHFTSAKPIAQKPSFAGMSNNVLSLQDLDADGTKQIVSRIPNAQGYFELDDQENWQRFVAFEQYPNISLSAPNVLQIDLNGDGRADLFVTEESVTRWYPSEGRAGYGLSETAPKETDEEKGPQMIWTDSVQRIFLADMSGDGLTDIVRIRNGEICYWPNLGYGRFGKKVTMHQSPVFANPELYSTNYLHLADLTGTGASDVIYLDGKSAKVWINFSGNSWSNPEIIPMPDTILPNRFSTADLLGNGTSCIIWSSPLAGNAHAPLRYIDLTAGKKPHLLFRTKNNSGKETTLTYKSSTQFYLEDKRNGKPWKTKLPFPVHCLWKTEHRELVTNTVLVSEYSYHHGYYDHAEREFRGFGRVDQKDTETFSNWKRKDASNLLDEKFHQPVNLVRTWFYTGAPTYGKDIFDFFEEEYWYKNPELISLLGTAPAGETKLPPVQFPPNLSPQELREAYRACKGMTLRQEVFSLDAEDANATVEEKVKMFTPYSVSTHNCQVQCLQHRGKNKFGIFINTESESLQYHYERRADDARISHSFNLEINQYGNVLKSASVVYGRQLQSAPVGTPPEVWTEQKKMHIVLAENNFTDDDFAGTGFIYHLPAACETKSYELTGIVLPLGKSIFSIGDLKSAFIAAVETGYEFIAPPDQILRKRLIEHSRILFLSEDLITPLPFKKMSPLGLTAQSFQLAFTLPVFRQIFPDTKIPDAEIDAKLGTEGKYVHFDDQHGNTDSHWWIRSGTINYPDLTKTRKRFFLPSSYTDQWGAVTSVFYHKEDASRCNPETHWGMIARSLDAIGNETAVLEFDFRALNAVRTKDINDNISEIIMDDLGKVIASAVFGKGNEADSLDQLKIQLANRAQQELITKQFLSLAQESDAAWLLQDATSRFVYDYESIPLCSAGIVRERHVQDLLQTGDPFKLHFSFEYSGGSGNVVMIKNRVAPGDAFAINAQNLKVLVQNVNPRWVGNGRTVLNNKGKPIKQYEPYFSTTHQYENDKALTEIGFSPVMIYDSAGRLVRTDFPDGTFSHTEFDSWAQLIFDANDNVKSSDWYAARINLPANDPKRKAAEKTELHDQTPGRMYLDSLGRTICAVAHNKWIDKNGNTKENFPKTFSHLDIEGNVRSVIDARGNTVVTSRFDMLGRSMYSLSMDNGEHWTFADIAGKPLYSWDSRNHRSFIEYDILHRPLNHYLSINGGADQLVGMTIYGEQAPLAKENNLRGLTWKNYDQSGLSKAIKFDFAGNGLEAERQIVSVYDQTIFWSAQNPDAQLDAEVFKSKMVYDALKRPVIIYSPETATIPVSEIRPQYDESGKLREVNARIRNSNSWTAFVKNISYNAKGQREFILYGNDVKTNYEYEAETYRMIHLLTTRNSGSSILQDLHYVFDPVANISSIRDDAQQTSYFNNTVVEPNSEYEYDSLYQLIRASGREHIGQNQPVTEWDAERTGKILPGDANAMQRYDQLYEYDLAGNIMKMIHDAGNGNPFSNKWTREYSYLSGNNQLDFTKVGNQQVNYTYNEHGSMLSMPHLQLMEWDFAEHLSHIQQGTTHAYYTYDGSGQRVRKVVEKQGGLREVRLYLGGFEIFRKYSNDVLVLERESLHITDDKNRIALIETCTLGDDENPQLIRYQFGNHLGSASLETDEFADIISYEEYHPYGTSSWQAGRSAAEVKLKRYRYTGMERDEESGLNYHSARYYAPWLGRWTATDPIGIGDGLNVYAYVKGNPVMVTDSSGKAGNKKKGGVEAEGERRNAARGGLTPDQIADIYITCPPIEYEGPATVELAQQQINLIEKGENKRKEAKIEAAKHPPLNKKERAQVAKESAQNFAVDKLDMGLKMLGLVYGGPLGYMYAGKLSEPLRAPKPPEFPSNFREWQWKQNYDFMQGTLTTVELGVSFVPAGEIYQAGKLALGKMPMLDGIGGMGGGKLIGFSEQWAAEANAGVKLSPPSLLQQAKAAGAAEEIEGPMEVFAHGTVGSTADEMISTQGANLSSRSGNFGGRFFAVPDTNVAGVFAKRTAAKIAGEEPAIVGFALPRSVTARLMQGPKPLLRRGPIPNPPEGVSTGAQEWIFEPGAIETLKNHGFFFPISLF